LATVEANAACEDAYDDELDHDRCTDCKGSGWYVGFTERRHCPTCDGSGYT
jgi:DnaJ-class molecular chaperone